MSARVPFGGEVLINLQTKYVFLARSWFVLVAGGLLDLLPNRYVSLLFLMRQG